MNKRQIIALLIICFCAIIMIMTKGRTEVNMVFTTMRTLSSLVFLGFTVTGVVIGILIR